MPINELAEKGASQALKAKNFNKALDILMKAYGSDIFRYCFNIVGSKEDAQDLLQIVFINAYRDFDQFKGNSSLKTWIFVIARNRCFDHIKQHKRYETRITLTNSVLDVQTQEMDDSCNRTGKILKTCLDKLTENSRNAMLLRFNAGFSYQELSHIINQKPGTIQATVVRAIPLLRQCLEENGVTL